MVFIHKKSLIISGIILIGIFSTIYASSTIINDNYIITPQLNTTKIFLNNTKLIANSSPFHQQTAQVTTSTTGIIIPAFTFNNTAMIFMKGSTNFNGFIEAVILSQSGSYVATSALQYTTPDDTQIIILPNDYTRQGLTGSNTIPTYPYNVEIEVLRQATTGNLNVTISYQ